MNKADVIENLRNAIKKMEKLVSNEEFSKLAAEIHPDVFDVDGDSLVIRP